jgi:hypothetical protein
MSQPESSYLSSPSPDPVPTAQEVLEECSALIGIASDHLVVLSKQCEKLSNEHDTTYEDMENDRKATKSAIDRHRDFVGEYLGSMAYGCDREPFIRKVQKLNAELKDALHGADDD